MEQEPNQLSEADIRSLNHIWIEQIIQSEEVTYPQVSHSPQRKSFTDSDWFRSLLGYAMLATLYYGFYRLLARII